MAKSNGSSMNTGYVASKPKCTRQGCSKNTKLSATSRNGRKRRYRGQG